MNEPIKVMILEDEPQIRRILRKIVERQEGFAVVSENGDFAGAITDFTKYRPDVVFVDVDLNGESGLECAKVMAELNPKLKIVFATAHSEYMANAFELYAFDYLVKPFNVERVNRTLAKIKGICQNSAVCEASAASVKQSTFNTGKLLIKGKEQVSFVDKKDIIFLERYDGATSIVTKDEIYRTSVSLSEMEVRLGATEFIRCHKSYIVNLSKITRIEVYGRWTYIVKMKDTDKTALMTAQCYEEIKKLYR